MARQCVRQSQCRVLTAAANDAEARDHDCDAVMVVVVVVVGRGWWWRVIGVVVMVVMVMVVVAGRRWRRALVVILNFLDPRLGFLQQFRVAHLKQLGCVRDRFQQLGVG